MSKVSIGEDEYEVADLLAYQQFNLWLYELTKKVNVIKRLTGSKYNDVVPNGFPKYRGFEGRSLQLVSFSRSFAF